MYTVSVASSRSYDVIIGSGLLSEAGDRIRALSKAQTAVIVSDDRVFPLYGASVSSSLQAAGFRTLSFVFHHGEKSKCVAVWNDLLEMMCGAHVTRSDLIVALGGGVVGDLAGFAAATYQRGIDFVQLPTTLLAAVDSSVGGKTAVDLAAGKNQVGCFYQPILVLCDTNTLRTLPEEEYRCGCAEIIKYAVIGSEPFFRDLSAVPVRDAYEKVIRTCVEMKRDFVMKDEYDRGQRMLLNFGHTFGHAAEALSGYTILHGQGVAIGMAVIARAAARRGILPEKDADALLSLIRLYGLPVDASWPADRMAEIALSDKKASGSTVRLIVPERIGSCRIVAVPSSELIRWLHDGGVR